MIVIRFEHVHEVYGGDATSQAPETNCPSCGARVPADADACEYCDESLTDEDEPFTDEDEPPTDEPSDYGWIGD